MSPRQRRDYCIEVEQDNLPARAVGAWVEGKYRRVGRYCELFSTGMKAKWDARVYIDLYAGEGFSRVRGTERVLLGSPLIALSVPDPFDRYVFCESNPDALAILKARTSRLFPNADVHYVPGDVNQNVERILEKVPQQRWGYKVLSFCFVDPFSVAIKFETLQRLAEGRAVDFLILLALGMDANRNISLYLKKQSPRIAEFLGNEQWRERWEKAQARGEDLIYFLAREFADSMSRLGYLPTAPGEMHPVRSDLKNLPLYYLAFFSKHDLGKRFWREVQKYSTDQQELGI
jgi:three-Cys-motif partner protein